MDVSSQLEQRIDVSKTIATLQSDGICFFEALFDHDTVIGLNDDFQNAFDKLPPGVNMGPKHPPGRIAVITTSMCEAVSLPTIFSIFMSLQFKAISDAILTKDSIYNDMIVLTHEKIAKPITDLHFDTQRSLKFLIYLLDTDVSNGAFSYAKRSHIENSAYRKKFLSQGGYLQELQNVPSEIESDTIDLEPITGPAGSVVIFDTDGWHSAGRLEDDTKERRIIRSRSVFAGQPSLQRPKRYSPKWFRRAYKICRYGQPIKIPGRGRTALTTRKK